MHNNLLDTLWQLQQNPDHDATDILLNTELSADEGQALQLRLLDRWLNEGETLGGWKIGMTSGESRDALGQGIRPFGFVLSSRLMPSGASIPRDNLYRGGVENELCFFMQEPLGAGASAATAHAAVQGAAPGFEINQKRLPPGCNAGVRIADNLSNWGIVAGDAVAAPRNLDELAVSLYRTPAAQREEQLVGCVESPGHIDDHYESLAVLARRLHDFGHQLQPGQWVITGAYEKHPFEVGDFRGDFSSGIGEVRVSLSA
jgi:2-keto-4-pentenoate hydratase